MKKIIVGVVVIAAVATGFWFYKTNAENREAQSYTVRLISGPTKPFLAFMNENNGVPQTGLDAYPDTKFSLSKNGETVTVTAKKVPHDFVTKLLSGYATNVPEKDAWGNELEFYVTSGWRDSNGFETGLLIRSPGVDGQFSGTTYNSGTFDSKQFSEDIVWLNGFIRSPE